MIKTRTIEQALSDMRSKSSVQMEEAVNVTGIAESTLYRKCSMTDPDVQFKITELVPVMKAFNRFDPLEVMARSCGFLMLKAPRGRAQFEDGLAHYHKEFSNLFSYLLDFMNRPSEEKIKVIESACIEHIRHTAEIRETVRRGDPQQEELLFIG